MMVYGRHQEHPFSARRLIIYYLYQHGYDRKHESYPHYRDIERVPRERAHARREPAERERTRIPHEHRGGRGIEQQIRDQRPDQTETNDRNGGIPALQRDQYAHRRKERYARRRRQPVQPVGQVDRVHRRKKDEDDDGDHPAAEFPSNGEERHVQLRQTRPVTVYPRKDRDTGLKEKFLPSPKSEVFFMFAF